LVLRGVSLQFSYVGSPQDMAEMMALVRGAGGIPMPVTRRPLCEANAALTELKAGRVVGRTVLVAEMQA
jgi:D-arabinose 1-dehydrogenase-like Zn-dependent alcohol dehydrogenase